MALKADDAISADGFCCVFDILPCDVGRVFSVVPYCRVDPSNFPYRRQYIMLCDHLSSLA
jgi:hypothetical protein